MTQKRENMMDHSLNLTPIQKSSSHKKIKGI